MSRLMVERDHAVCRACGQPIVEANRERPWLACAFCGDSTDGPWSREHVNVRLEGWSGYVGPGWCWLCEACAERLSDHLTEPPDSGDSP